MKVSAITVRKGHVLEIDGKLWAVQHSEIMQPGKGASVIHIEMRDVKTGTKDNVRYRTQETVEKVRLEQEDYQYLFNDGENYTFMHQTNFEQINIPAEVVGSPATEFLQEGMIVTVELYEELALGIELPQTVICEIVEADPVVKGQTASSSYKPAKLDNGLRVMVPPHVESGTRIVVKTEDASYVERAKD